MTLERRATRLRAAVERVAARGSGRRYTEAFRHEVLEFLKDWRRAGRSTAGAARELGLSDPTLRYWDNAAGGGGAARREFRRVDVVPERTSEQRARFVVHCAGSLRVEGMEVAELAELVRSLA